MWYMKVTQRPSFCGRLIIYVVSLSFCCQLRVNAKVESDHNHDMIQAKGIEKSSKSSTNLAKPSDLKGDLVNELRDENQARPMKDSKGFKDLKTIPPNKASNHNDINVSQNKATKKIITTRGRKTPRMEQSTQSSTNGRVTIDHMSEFTKSQNRPQERLTMWDIDLYSILDFLKGKSATESPSKKQITTDDKQRTQSVTTYPTGNAAHQHRPRTNSSFPNQSSQGREQRTPESNSSRVENKSREIESQKLETSSQGHVVLPRRPVTVNHMSEYTKNLNRPRQRNKMNKRNGFRKSKGIASTVSSLPPISPGLPTSNEEKLSEKDVILQRTNQFKELLLEKLRMSADELTNPRLIRGIPKLPETILEQTLKDNAREESIDDFYAKDEELIITGKDLKNKCIRGRQVTGCYLFVLEGQVRGDVASAQLWFYKTPDANDNSGQTTRVFQLEKTRSGRIQRRNLMVRGDSDVKEGWVSMNITRSVKSWVDKRMSTAMMAIRCDTCRTRSHRSLYGAKNGYKPLVVIKYDTSNDNMYSRSRRTADDCNMAYECCKKPLIVNIRRLFQNVIQPEYMSIGYCYGNCNNAANPTYNHTVLRTHARLNEPNISSGVRSQLDPCCAPVALRDTYLLLIENGGLTRNLVPNIIVSTCGCV